MSNDPINDIREKATKLTISSKHIGWIVAAALLIYFNTGLRAYAADVHPVSMQLEWNTVLKHFQVDSDKFVGQQFSLQCPERTVRDSDDAINGTGIYPSTSPICVAAVHAGAVGPEGGQIKLQLNPGIEQYTGSKSNGIESGNFPQTQRSIVFVDEGLVQAMNQVQRDYAPRLKWNTKFTSTGLANMKLVGQQFVFHCPMAPANLAGRRVYGTDRYAFNSLVCLAAVHAGHITEDGGFVTVQMEEPAGKLEGSIRYGIESKSGPAGTRQLVFPSAADSVVSIQ